MSKLIIACAIVCACAAGARAQAVGVERLRDVASVYVPEWGKTERAQALRQEIVRRLGASGRVRVVASRAAADAVLDLSVREVSKNVDVPQLGSDLTMKIGSRVVAAEVLVFSLSVRGGRALWSDKLNPGDFRGKDETHTARAVGDRLGRDLLRAIEKDRRRHGRERGGDGAFPADVART